MPKRPSFVESVLGALVTKPLPPTQQYPRQGDVEIALQTVTGGARSTRPPVRPTRVALNPQRPGGIAGGGLPREPIQYGYSPRGEFEAEATGVLGAAAVAGGAIAADQLGPSVAVGSNLDNRVRQFVGTGTKPADNSLRGQVNQFIDNETRFAGQLGRDLGDVRDAVADYLGIKGLTYVGEQGARLAGEMAAGAVRIPAIEIGAQTFTGTAGQGEEAAIAALQERERVSREVAAGLSIVRGVLTQGDGLLNTLVIADP